MKTATINTFLLAIFKATVSRNHVFLLAVNLRKQSIKMNLHWRFMIWTHNFISMAPALSEPPVKKGWRQEKAPVYWCATNSFCSSANHSAAVPLPGQPSSPEPPSIPTRDGEEEEESERKGADDDLTRCRWGPRRNPSHKRGRGWRVGTGAVIGWGAGD